MGSRLLKIFLVVFCSFVLPSGYPVLADSWIGSVRGVSKKYEPFIIETVGEADGHLTATASYSDYRGKDVSHLPVTIEGVQTSDDSFWPHVTAQVSNDPGREWKAIGSTKRNGEPATVTLDRNRPNIWLHLDLDCFRPMIGKFRYGKVTLRNGQTAMFDMKDLLPRNGPPHAWNVELLHSEPDPLIKRPFAIAGVDSMGEDLRAVCAYVDVGSTSTASIEGRQTPDGLFWPYVIAQVASDYEGIWKTIGEPPSLGRPITLSIKSGDVNTQLVVDLEVFRPMIGKFRYGRIVLKNGKVAEFELKYLLPPRESESKCDAQKH
jgi:hypothetical protein